MRKEGDRRDICLGVAVIHSDLSHKVHFRNTDLHFARVFKLVQPYP